MLRDDLDYRRDEVVIATKGGVRIDGILERAVPVIGPSPER
jgi:aryl-alcohol dehydrogenase-like predicted oxidoreductase